MELTDFIGQRGPTVAGPDAVNLPMIRHWCAAIGGRNPAVAGEAPPAMLQAWVMPGFGAAPPPADPVAAFHRAAVAAGYGAIAATNTEQEYLRPLRIGDIVHVTKTIRDVSGEKSTALGRGLFLTTDFDFTDQHGEPVAKMVHRVLRFRPGSARPKPPGTAAATPAAEAPAGERLPDLEIELSRTLIVACAIASRDYQDIHHDPDVAHAHGFQDIFPNILTTNGWVGRFVTDALGSGAVLRSIAIKLGATCYPGQTLVIGGHVLSREPGPGGTELAIEVKGTAGGNTHVSGRVTASWQQPPD